MVSLFRTISSNLKENLISFRSSIMLLMILFCSCGSVLKKQLDKELSTQFYENQLTGILFYDPETKDTIYKLNHSKYFTPASNVKIFTLYSGIKLLGDSIPTFKFKITNDTITIIGCGNPTTLHPYFKDSTAIRFLKSFEKINIYRDNFIDEKYGPGWAWEDFDSYYNVERNGFPLYGNVLTICANSSIDVSPEIMENRILFNSNKTIREFDQNRFFVKNIENDTIIIPMVIDEDLDSLLWYNLFPNKINFTNHFPKGQLETHFSKMPIDILFKRMMQQSDNFLAEQIMLMASSAISDSLSFNIARNEILGQNLYNLKEEPRWVDGSGLSRYNLFTPKSLVQVLEKLYYEIPQERLLAIFPSGGKSGTLKSWYKGNREPYIYAKSGSLGNNYSLSGYLITKSGKVIIFSFMNNHFRKSSNEVKQRMQDIFEFIYESY